MENARLLSLNDVAKRTSLSRTAINKHRAAGTFPKEVYLTESRFAFVVAEIDEWIDERIAARNQVSA